MSVVLALAPPSSRNTTPYTTDPITPYTNVATISGTAS
jgi:hypothetical protein